MIRNCTFWPCPLWPIIKVAGNDVNFQDILKPQGEMLGKNEIYEYSLNLYFLPIAPQNT